MTKPVLYGGIEGGGTKFVCAVGTGPEDIQAEIRFPTTTPAETMERTIDFFRQYRRFLPLDWLVLVRWIPIPFHPLTDRSFPHPSRVGPAPTWWGC